MCILIWDCSWYLCIPRIVLNADPYTKHQPVHDLWSLLVMFKCMRLSGCSSWNDMENVFQLNNKIPKCLFNDCVFCLHGHNSSYLTHWSKLVFNLSTALGLSVLWKLIREYTFLALLFVCWLRHTDELLSLLTDNPSVCPESLRMLVDSHPLILF